MGTSLRTREDAGRSDGGTSGMTSLTCINGGRQLTLNTDRRNDTSEYVSWEMGHCSVACIVQAALPSGGAGRGL